MILIRMISLCQLELQMIYLQRNIQNTKSKSQDCKNQTTEIINNSLESLNHGLLYYRVRISHKLSTCDRKSCENTFYEDRTGYTCHQGVIIPTNQVMSLGNFTSKNHLRWLQISLCSLEKT